MTKYRQEVEKMPDFFQDKKMHQYFSSLPGFVQESIVQGGVKYNSLPELQSAADRLMQSNGGGANAR